MAGQRVKTLIIDNYDSFTYNLYQYLKELGGNPSVFKNDEIKISDIKKIKPTHIVISPGPGTVLKKKDFGICGKIIRKFHEEIPILGVCLGHQGIISAFSGKIEKAKPIHGKQSMIKILRRQNCAYPSLFLNIKKRVKVMRYHSLKVSAKNFPKEFVITCKTVKDKIIMGIQHKFYPLYGIQFHPESFGTPDGKRILKNFLDLELRI